MDLVHLGSGSFGAAAPPKVAPLRLLVVLVVAAEADFTAVVSSAVISVMISKRRFFAANV